MMRRFVIGVSGLSKDKSTAFKDTLNEYGGWWHWIGNFWLLVTDDEDLDVEVLRDRLSSLEAERAVVFEFPEDISWATLGGVNKDGKHMADWLKNTWADDD